MEEIKRYIEANYIPKKKILDKINELEDKREEYMIMYSNHNEHEVFNEQTKYITEQIMILRELLEDTDQHIPRID